MGCKFIFGCPPYQTLRFAQGDIVCHPGQFLCEAREEYVRGVVSCFKTARATVALPLLVAIALLAASCSNSDALKNVRGLLTDVQARSISQVETLTVEEQGTGKQWMFQTDGDIGPTPSHLRAHMLQGEPVTVHYMERDGRLLAVKVTD